MRWAAGSLAGVGLAPALAGLQMIGSGSRPPGRRPGARPEGRTPAAGEGTDGLPPRAVGLRSLGGDFVFDPAGLRLEPGSTLTWLNMGDFHTATAFHPDNGDLLSGQVPLRIPEGAEPWHSGMLGLTGGTEYTHTFRVPGVYDYFCQPHYSFGMVGRIVVRPADGSTPRARPLSELNEASREEMPGVEAILGAAGRAFEWSARINGVLLLRAHGEAAGPPASRLAEAMARDEELGGLLEREGQAARALSALENFVGAVEGEAGYEGLLASADDAKAPLAAAAAGASRRPSCRPMSRAPVPRAHHGSPVAGAPPGPRGNSRRASSVTPMNHEAAPVEPGAADHRQRRRTRWTARGRS